MPERQFIVRPACIKDMATLIGLLRELFTLEIDYMPDSRRQRCGLEQLLQMDDAVVLVAERCGKVVGMCTVQTVISTAEGGPAGLLEDMFVETEYRRQGVGRGLLQAAESWAADRGLMRLQLLTEFNNTEALAFYFSAGWRNTRLTCLRKMPQRR
jgi:GNAT superfamily N-acetyltransferase